MDDAGDFYFEPNYRFLICKLHGNGVYPTKDAIKRHLRGEGHRCRGQALKEALSVLTALPLNSLEEIRSGRLSTQLVLPPLPYLKILSGWRCILCADAFLTTSLEIVKRHAAANHNHRHRRTSIWEVCQLQTFFSETSERRYLQVSGMGAGATTNPEASHGDKNDGSPRFQARQFSKPRTGQRRIVSNRPISTSSSLVTSQSTHKANGRNTAIQWVSSLQPSTPVSSPASALECWHAFTPFAAKHVDLSVYRLDSLLKSDAFRSVSEPLFDSRHVDASLNMQAVFPKGEEDPLFMNALLFSIVQTINGGSLTREGLSLQSRIVFLLNEKLATVQGLSSTDIGAIIILKTTAYKTLDFIAYQTHSHGLNKALEVTGDESILTPAAKRSLFWLDLFGALLLDCARQMSHLDLPQKIGWRREARSNLSEALLPKGFGRHRHELPDGLLECISDTIELEELLTNRGIAQSSHRAKYHRIDTMQASIECRLVSQGKLCTGIVAESVRLAVFMCCYCSWMETWNVSLIPCRLAKKLMDLLEPTFAAHEEFGIWIQSMDLLLWLLLVIASVAELDQGHVKDLKAKRSRLILSARLILSHRAHINLRHAVKSALQDFMYSNDWLSRRGRIKDWFELEHLFHADDIALLDSGVNST